MPAHAGLIIVVGVRTVKPGEIRAVWKTGQVQAVTMAVTLVLTIVIPLQFAVLVGVGMSTVLFVIQKSNDLVIKRIVVVETNFKEVDPPSEVGTDEVVLIQPYGSLFFASAAVFENRLPAVTSASQNSVVIIRMRGRTDLGSTLTDTLGRYAETLQRADSKLVIISDSHRVQVQLAVTGVAASIGAENLYESDEWLGSTMRRAYQDAEEWIARNAR